MRKVLVPLLATVLTVGAMAYQARTVEPVLAAAMDVRLGEIEGFESEVMQPSEAELTVLPEDTAFDKRIYRAKDGQVFQVSIVFGGRSKSSIHRPELCLPAQGFQMMRPRDVSVGGVDWHVVSLARGDVREMSCAYTFFNQDGFRTSSHVRRIFRDVWDRSIHGRIDRWAMVTVHASVPDDLRLTRFLSLLKGVVAR